jgi:hypothetical protein
MGWQVVPRKPNGLDRLIQAQANAEALARQHGWGPLVSVGENGDHVVFNFAAGSQVWWRPASDPTTDNSPGTTNQ